MVGVAVSGGGHTGYALAIIHVLLSRGFDVVAFLDPFDRWSAARLASRYSGVRVAYVHRFRGVGEPLYMAGFRAPVAGVDLLKVRDLVCGLDCLVATGSNHSLAVALGAYVSGVGIVALEAVDRVVSGSLATRILWRLGAIVALHWPLQKRLYPYRSIVVGPVYEPPRRVEPPVEPGYVLVLTGSVGNPRLIGLLLRTRLDRVVVQTGRATPPELVRRLRPGWVAFRYTADVAPWIAGASVVVGHQGLGVVEAALAYGKPVVIGFNPDLPATSGWRDAVELARLLNGVVVDPRRASPRDLEEAVEVAASRRPPRYPWGARVLVERVLPEVCG